MLKLDVSNISPRSDREATAGTLFQFIVYRTKRARPEMALPNLFLEVSIYIIRFYIIRFYL